VKHRVATELAIEWLRKKLFHVARTPDGFVAVNKSGAMIAVNRKRSKLAYFNRDNAWTEIRNEGHPVLEWFQSAVLNYEKEML
jgi:hypothetical protein